MVALPVRASRWTTEGTVSRRVFQAAVTVGGLTLAVRGLEAGAHLFMAHRFGIADEVDAFLIAYLVPSFVLNVVAGSLTAAAIPLYIRIRQEEGPAAAQGLISSVGLVCLLGLSGLWGALALSAQDVLPVLGSGFDRDKLALTRSLFQVLLPVLVFAGMGRVWAAVLNAHDDFALAAAAPVAKPLLMILAMLFVSGTWGIQALAAGVLVGSVLEAGIVARRLLAGGVSPVPAWRGMGRAVGQLTRQFAPMAAGVSLYASTELVDQAMAAMLGEGAVSALGYGNRVVMFLLVVSSGAIGTAILPHFSRMAAARDWTGIRSTLGNQVRWIGLFSVPGALALFGLSEPLVRVLFERGAFSAADTLAVAGVQSIYALQAPFFLLNIVLVRLISALQQNLLLVFAGLICVPLNAALNYALMRPLGVAGIALSTVLVQAVTLALLGLMTHRLLRKTSLAGSGRDLGRAGRA